MMIYLLQLAVLGSREEGEVWTRGAGMAPPSDFHAHRPFAMGEDSF